MSFYEQIRWTVKNGCPFHRACSVAVILLNWKRKENIPPIIGALKASTVPMDIILIDNSDEEQYHVEMYAKDVQIYARMEGECNRYGPSSRWLYLSCLVSYDLLSYDFVFMVDDDYLPNIESAAFLRNTALQHPDYWLIGEDGRIFEKEYNFHSPSRIHEAVREVTLLVRGYIVNIKIVPYLQRMFEAVACAGNQTLFFEDDMIAAHSAKLAGKKCGLAPIEVCEQQRLIWHPLPEPHSLSGRPADRWAQRTQAWERLNEIRKTLESQQ